ncbi:XRE family transcriptional regulator [Paenibacillus sp. NRS-1782]|uniref:XRE family transcriptional regulator n=1 Tax=unclassified Paenibacillus TaxID=185978 RepID=UPI003D27813D
MNNNKHPVTDFGWAIKQKLVERHMDQQAFCETYQIPTSRISNLIHGTRKAKRYRRLVSELLGIDDTFTK